MVNQGGHMTADSSELAYWLACEGLIADQSPWDPDHHYAVRAVRPNPGPAPH